MARATPVETIGTPWAMLLTGAPGCLAGGGVVFFASTTFLGGAGGLIVTAVHIVAATAVATFRPLEKLFLRCLHRRIDPRTDFDDTLVFYLNMATAGHLDDFDWYVDDDQSANAAAYGRHSIALTQGLLDAYLEDVLEAEHLGAIAAHEVGHIISRTNQSGAAVVILTLPWILLRDGTRGAFRWAFTSGSLFGFCMGLAGVWIFLTLPLVMALQSHPAAWVIIVGYVAVLMVLRLLELALRRADEFRADAHAVHRGLGEALAEYLTWGTRESPRWSLLNTHPASYMRVQRIHELMTGAGRR